MAEKMREHEDENASSKGIRAGFRRDMVALSSVVAVEWMPHDSMLLMIRMPTPGWSCSKTVAVPKMVNKTAGRGSGANDENICTYSQRKVAM